MALVRTFRLALCALVLLGLTGCSDQVIGDPPICLPSPSPSPEAAEYSGLMKVGQPFTLSVMPLPPPACSGESGDPTSVTAEIEGPSGAPIEGHIELGAPKAPAILRFTPVRPGLHHIVVAFSRVGGLHQFDFHAAADSSTTAPGYTLSRPCVSVERTQKGAWVCDTAVLRGDTVVETFPNTRLAVAGDVIWAVSGSDVHRYVDTGTDLVLTGALSHPQGDATFLLPSADELAVVHGLTLVLYTFDSGTLSTAGSTPFTGPYIPMGSGGPHGLFLREDSQLAFVTFRSFDIELMIQVCPYQLVSGRIERTSSPCVRMRGEVVGFEPRALWTQDPPSLIEGREVQGLLRRWEWIGGHLIERGSVSLGAHARLVAQRMASPSIVPVFHADQSGGFSGANTAVAVWSEEQRTIHFEHLDADVSHFNASPTFYWGVTLQTVPHRTTKIRLRPQAPIR